LRFLSLCRFSFLLREQRFFSLRRPRVELAQVRMRPAHFVFAEAAAITTACAVGGKHRQHQSGTLIGRQQSPVRRRPDCKARGPAKRASVSQVSIGMAGRDVQGVDAVTTADIQ